METIIKKVRIFDSESIIHNGRDMGPGFAIVVTPTPVTNHQNLKIWYWRMNNAQTCNGNDISTKD